MRNLHVPALLIALLASVPGCRPADDAVASAVVVDAACGQCQFGLEGGGCDLAVRIDEQAYYVDGTAIDDHGDAHGTGGFCNTVRRAEVTGDVVDGRFAVKTFVLLPADDGS